MKILKDKILQKRIRPKMITEEIDFSNYSETNINTSLPMTIGPTTDITISTTEYPE